MALVVLIGAGMLAYRAAGSPPPNPAPTAPPRPVDPNALAYRYLTGITVPALTEALRRDGFSCAGPAPPENNLSAWRCDRRRGTQDDVVQIWAVDGSHVHLVDVTTVAQNGPLDEQGALQLDTSIAHIVYGASSSEATAAINWIDANPNGGITTQIGEIRLRTERTDVATLLEFDAGSRG